MPERATPGAMIRSARKSRGWTQEELGSRCRLSRSGIAAIESGGNTGIETLARVCDALDGELVIEARFPFAGTGRPQLDRGHAKCVGFVRRLLESAGYDCATEQEVLDGAWRGWIDLVGYQAALRRLVIVEVKTELHDVGALDRQVNRYVRLCLAVAARNGWSVAEIVVIVVVLATTANDAFLVANREVLGAAFPIRGRVAVACLLDGGPVRARMLLMLDPRRRGRRSLLRTMADGRRTAAPYADYRSFVAALDAPRSDGSPGVGAPAGAAPVPRLRPRGTRAQMPATVAEAGRPERGVARNTQVGVISEREETRIRH